MNWLVKLALGVLFILSFLALGFGFNALMQMVAAGKPIGLLDVMALTANFAFFVLNVSLIVNRRKS